MTNPESLLNLDKLTNHELGRRCYRMIYLNTRSFWRGSRTALRRRIRNFLRLRSQNRAYMCSLLRGIAASSIFAAALLGLTAAPAQAQALDPSFSLNPFPIVGLDVGANSHPALADLDGDGDLDMVSGESYGAFLYYENIGTPFSRNFVERTGAANPLNGFNLDYYSAPTFADLDDDGDMDVVAGNASGGFAYYENTGTAANPSFVERTGAANPLDGFVLDYYSSPVLADLDGDSDLDLLVGDSTGALFYFENTGTSMSAAFVARTGTANPLDGLGVDSFSSPALADLDEDGDLDLTVGEYGGQFAYFENTGSAMSPTFAQQSGVSNPFNGFDIGFNATPAFADLDGDGDLDCVSGEYDGMFRTFSNTTAIANSNFTEVVGPMNPLNGYSTSGYSAPQLVDLDDDGDLDLVSGDYYGEFLYYENTGSVETPVYVERMGAENPLSGFGVGYNSMPSLVDLDNDGDLDLVAGSYFGTFDYFENTGSASSPAFVQRTGISNPFDSLSAGYYAAPAMADLDGDGDFDLVAGEGTYYGEFLYFENTGSASTPSFTERTGMANPLVGFSVGGVSNPTLVDFDGDGDFDVVSGALDGGLFYFENTGSALSPAFVERIGAENPFRGLDPGTSSTPVLGDLNDDGVIDLVAGNTTGTFVYYVPEPQGWMALFGGAGMLARFKRSRFSKAREE